MMRGGVIVSIHAPVKGATATRREEHATVIVSIHAPVKGATRLACLFLWLSSFNPRAREGRDLRHHAYICVYEFQSTRP